MARHPVPNATPPESRSVVTISAMGKARATNGCDQAKSSSKRRTNASRMPTTGERMALWLRELMRLNDHSLIIVGCSFIDDQLGTLVGEVFQENEHSRKVLERDFGSFGERINLAASLGLITTERARALDLIRKLRNHAAHANTQCNLSRSPELDWMKAMFGESVTSKTGRRAMRNLLAHWCLFHALVLTLLHAGVFGAKCGSGGVIVLPISPKMQEDSERDAWRLMKQTRPNRMVRRRRRVARNEATRSTDSLSDPAPAPAPRTVP